MAKLERLLLDMVMHPIKSINFLYLSLLKTPFVSRIVSTRFHKLYYRNEKQTWGNTRWMGVGVLKCPFDLWIYQEILHEVRPDILIECGTASGGSALYFASLMDLFGKGKVVSIDLNPVDHRPRHERITYLDGSSTSPEILRTVTEAIKPTDTVLVVLDSDHSKAHVLDELRLYSPLVTLNSYIVVEDSNQNGHPVSPFTGPGPMEAIDEFMRDNTRFLVDRTREKYYLTFNPSGYIKRIA